MRHQRILSRFGALALVEEDLPTLLHQAAECAAEGLGMPRAKVLRYRAESDDLLVVAGVGWHEGVVGRGTVPNDPDTPPGRSLATRQPTVANDLTRPGGLRPTRLLLEHDVVSALNVPVGSETPPWGVLEVDGSQPCSFHETDVLFVQGFAHLLGAAIRRLEAEADARAERAAREMARDRLLRLLEGTTDCVVVIGPDWRILYQNARARTLASGGRDLTGAQFWEAFPGKEGTEFWQRYHDVMEKRRPDAFEAFEPMLGRWLEVHAHASGEGMTLFFRDVTERHRQQKALADSEARYRAAFEQVAVGIGESDQTGRLVRANDRYCAITGYPRDELLQLRFQDITHPDDLPTGLALTGQLYAGEIASFVQEKRYIRKDGSIVWVSMSCSAVRDRRGRPAYMLAVIEDISARRQAEAEREELLRRQELLMREMNHRIKNSLQMVALLVHMQAADMKDPAVRARFEETATRIATVALVHRRLYQSAGVESVESAPYLRDLCADIGAALALGDRLAVDAVNEVLPADTAIALGLAVNELVTNAAKYAYPAGEGPVRVSFDRAADGRLRLAVSDEGVGLPPGFEPSASPGLGMRVLVALADKIDAELRVTDLRPGTCFQVVMRG